MRSILTVALREPALLDRAFAAGADAVVLDLVSEESDTSGRIAARLRARDILRSAQIDAHRPHLYVRLETLDDDQFDADLGAVMIGEPDGILLGRSRSGLDVQQLGVRLAVQEAEYGLADGETSIIAEAGASARALFTLGTYGNTSPRLVGLAWSAERLASDLGFDVQPADFVEVAPLHTARHLTLFAAHAAEVAAIDTASGLDGEAFRRDCAAARRHGFNAKLTTNTNQVAIINEVFGRE